LWTATPAEDDWLDARADALSRRERAELASIRSPGTRRRAISARILLRLALSQACGGSVPPSAWRFCAGPDGKPEIASGLPQLHFSVSHGEELAVVAVSRDRPLGVDVEELDQGVNEAVISDFLSPAEQQAMACDRALRANQFLRLWTLKEAYSKLVGNGLAADFARIEFDIAEPELRATPYGQADAQFVTFVARTASRQCQVSLAVAASQQSLTQAPGGRD
jgi:phosphopantetheine--protein transferase-like protein